MSSEIFAIDINSAINYTLEKGLPTNTIHAIHQDETGYLWIASQAGLSRFNGDTIHTFSRKNGMAKNEISELLKVDHRI